MNTTSHPALWLAPAALLGIAILPLPYGYYLLLRLVVCSVAGYLAYLEWSQDERINVWSVVLAIIALLFNPLLPVHLTKEVWQGVDAATATLLLGHWWLRGRST